MYCRRCCLKISLHISFGWWTTIQLCIVVNKSQVLTLLQIRNIADRLKQETEIQKKATSRILGAAAQISAFPGVLFPDFVDKTGGHTILTALNNIQLSMVLAHQLFLNHPIGIILMLLATGLWM